MTTKKVLCFLIWFASCIIVWGFAILGMLTGNVLAMNALRFIIPVRLFFAAVLSFSKHQREKEGNTDPLLDNIIPVPIRTLEGLAFAVLLGAYAHYVFATLCVIHTLLEADLYKTNGQSGVYAQAERPDNEAS